MSNAGLSNYRLVSYSDEETKEYGRQLGLKLIPNSIVCLFGDLGAGKTTFIKGIVEGAAGNSSEFVNSPTFVYLNIYKGTKTVYHFDLYRLRDAEEFLSMGFDEYFYCQGVCCIEWSERIHNLIPNESVKVVLNPLDERTRQIQLTSWMGE